MSSPNRTKVFVGFGAVAIVLVAAIAMWPPNFRSEEASGAIGAVQKHHAPQIAQKDVILSDQKTAAQQSWLWTDYLNDSARLQALSASLASRDEAASITKNAEELSNQLRNEYASHMASALNAIELQAKQSNNAEMASKAEELASQLKGNEQLSAALMNQLNTKFANVAEMAHKIILQNAEMANKTANQEMGHKIILQNAEMANKTANQEMGQRIILQNADKELASALADKNEQAASKVSSIEQELSNVNLASVEMASQVAYFSQIEAASHAVANAEALASQEMASRIVGAKEVADRADQLAHAALFNVEAQVASSVEMAATIQHMQSALASSDLANSSLANRLNSLSQEFASHTASNLQSQLASMSELAASRATFSKLENSTQMQASMVSNQLASHQLFNQLANTAELAAACASISHSLQNEALASALANETALAAQATQLQNHLASKSF